MARASLRLIGALRETAARLERADTVYRWSQLAHCNCGLLTQAITGLTPGAIHEAAARQRGDWAEQARTAALAAPAADYGDRPALDEGAWEPEDLGICPVAELSMTQIFSELSRVGLEAADIGAFERLDDPLVRRRLGTSTQDYLHSDRRNVIAYARAWADVLQERLLEQRPELAAALAGDASAAFRDALEDGLPLAAE